MSRFNSLRASFIQYISGFQWGIVARNYVMQWKSISEMVATMSYRLNNTNEEKYEIMARDTVSERIELMEKALYEFIEISKLATEAERPRRLLMNSFTGRMLLRSRLISCKSS